MGELTLTFKAPVLDAGESLGHVVPEILLVCTALFILVAGLWIKRKDVLAIVALAAIVVAEGLLQPPGSAKLFLNMLVDDSFAAFFRLVSLIIAGLFLVLSVAYDRFAEDDAAEYYFLLLTVTVGMMLAVSTTNLIMVYIAFEMVSLVSYILVGYLKRDALSSEAALKYFLFGALATGVMLYGISLVYGLFGTTDLVGVRDALVAGRVTPLAAVLPLLLILAGLCFKCGLAPFHMWVPDAYQGAPTPVTAFISVGPKAVGFAVFLRIFATGFGHVSTEWIDIVMAVSIVTMTVGNIVAISQVNIKRMLGYSSIAQAGYILIGIAVSSRTGMEGVLYYILVYALMNLGAFGCILVISAATKSDMIEDYAGYHEKDPIHAFILTVFLLSLAGLPPLGGFFAKFLVFSAAIESRYLAIAIVGVVNSVIALFYYVKVIRYMYLEAPSPATQSAPPSSPPMALRMGLFAALLGVLVLGLYPVPFLNWVRLSLLK